MPHVPVEVTWDPGECRRIVRLSHHVDGALGSVVQRLGDRHGVAESRAIGIEPGGPTHLQTRPQQRPGEGFIEVEPHRLGGDDDVDAAQQPVGALPRVSGLGAARARRMASRRP